MINKALVKLECFSDSGFNRLKELISQVVPSVRRDTRTSKRDCISEKGEAALLADAYLNSIKRASENRVSSISFPSLSTGAYGYPFDEAAPFALKTVIKYLKQNDDIKHVRFVLFGEEAYRAYELALKGLV